MDPPASSPHSRNHPDNLLRRRRVHNPGHYQPGHPDEEGPEDFLHLLVLSERLDRSSRVRLHRRLDKRRQEQDRPPLMKASEISVRHAIEIPSGTAIIPASIAARISALYE